MWKRWQAIIWVKVTMLYEVKWRPCASMKQIISGKILIICFWIYSLFLYLTYYIVLHVLQSKSCPINLPQPKTIFGNLMYNRVSYNQGDSVKMTEHNTWISYNICWDFYIDSEYSILLNIISRKSLDLTMGWSSYISYIFVGKPWWFRLFLTSMSCCSNGHWWSTCSLQV